MTKVETITVIIAGLVSIVISMVTYIGVLRNLKETQFQEILKERIKAYSCLWGILIKYGNINFYHKLKYDKNWVIDYHDELDQCNIKYGVLFSKDVHDYFEKLRGGLQEIRHRIEENSEYEKSEKFQLDCIELYKIIDDKENSRKGLGGLLKKGLGSFRRPILAGTDNIK